MVRIHSLFIGLAAAILLSACLFNPLPFDEEEWLKTVENTDSRDLYAKNYADGVYKNPWLTQRNRSFATFLRWRFSSRPSYSKEAENNQPAVIPALLDRIDALDHAENFLVWIGHATFLLRLQGDYWLTDPMFSKRALLPPRITQPALDIDELGRLEGRLNVLISHNHYDHLDKESLRALPAETTFYVPLGLGPFVASLVLGPVIEMNWWDELHPGNSATLTCLPAQHWSRRLFQRYNSTLWASFMIQDAEHTVYFGGDSGYFIGYREIGRRFDNIDYALLPITAYEPRWFMHYAHMDTEEAIRAFEDLGAAYFVPTQWGTFRLGDNPPGLPPLELRRNIERLQLDPQRFLVLDIGRIHLLEEL